MTRALHGKSKTRQTWLMAIAVAMVAFAALAGGGLLMGDGTAKAAGTVVVTQTNGVDWFPADTRAPGVGTFRIGPGTPPLGTGSFEMKTLTDPEKVQLFTNRYAGTLLSNVQGIGYSTYRDPSSTGFIAGVAALNIRVDLDGNGTADAYMVYEPYQDLGNAAVLTGVWQNWDAYRAGAAKWWINTNASGCGQSTPCTWSTIVAANPNATVREAASCGPANVTTPCPGSLGVNQGSSNSGIVSSVDALYVNVLGDTTTFNFEPVPQCTTVCYANSATGNDANGGASAANAKKTIQAAINQVNAGGQVRVFPGTYNESAPGSAPTTIAGTYQFGLFFGSAKPGITLMGVTAADVPITNAGATLATINTNATNNFGTDGIFVEASGTTIQGVKIGPNLIGDNKTIEVVADNFTLRYSTTAIPGGGGSIYIDDFSPGGTVVKSYHILDNIFPDGTSVDIASGAGFTGPVSGREIRRNSFDLVNNGFNGISFNGSGGVAWFVNPVGGAVIEDNSFKNSTQYIRARGVYDNTQFDWKSFWEDNTYDKATVTLVTEAPFDVRTYAYSVFTNVRRIGATIQEEVDHAVSGDTVLAKKGSYVENVTIPVSLTLKGARAGASVSGRTFPNASESTITGQVTIQAPSVTIDGVAVTNPGQSMGIRVKTAGDYARIKNSIVDTVGGPTFAGGGGAQGVYLEYGPDNVTVLNNRINNIQSDRSAKAILIGDSTSSNPSLNILIKGNTLSNVKSNLKGAYGVQVNNGSSTAPTATGYTTLRVKDNTFSSFVGGWAHAIGLEGDTPIAVIEGNVISGVVDLTPTPFNDSLAVWFEDNPSFALAQVHRNAFNVGPASYGIAVHPALTGVIGSGSLSGTCNWWGAKDGPGLVGPGSGALVTPGVTFSPWLKSADLEGKCKGDDKDGGDDSHDAPHPSSDD